MRAHTRALAREACLALTAVATLGAAAPAPVPAVAQGRVRGQLTLIEREGDHAGDLRDAVVYLEGAGAARADGDAVPESTEIAMRRREFLPHVRLVRAGGSVAFPNEDPFSHNVFSNTALGAFDLGLYRFRASRAATFERPGVYPIYCNIHHRMVSFVVAVPGELAAMVDADGSFAIQGVPAGRYRLYAWHERAGRVSQEVEVPAAGLSDVQLQLDARAYVPSPHRNKFGQPYTATRADRY